MEINTPDKNLMEDCFEQKTLLNQYNKGFEGFPDLPLSPPPYDWANFLVYRSKDKDGVDLDVSPVAMWTYCLMYGWETGKICKQTEKENCHKYQIKHNGHIYRGDAMTSAWTPFILYISNLLYYNQNETTFKGESIRSILEQLTFGFSKNPIRLKSPDSPYKDIPRLASKLADKSTPCDSNEDKFFQVLDQKMSQHAKDFCRLYLSAGNFLMVPEHFNSERSGLGRKADYDTADRMLWKIYQYFEAWKKMWIGCDALNQLFFSQSAPNCKQWFCDCDIIADPWKKFLEVHLLQDFVMNFNDGDLRPISFKNSTLDSKKPVEEFADKNGEYYPLPQRPPKGDFDIILTQYENFFATANDCIRKRGEKIWDKIKDKL